MNATDMTAPVTRGELREELALLKQDTHQQISALEERLLKKTSWDLEIWGGALLERIKESEQRLAKQLSAEITGEIARHVGAAQEDMRTQFAAFHEAFADLPRRVTRLEAAVFPAPGDA